MHTKTCLDIHTYWDRIRGAEAGPLRSDIQPGDVRHILPELFILELDEAGNPVFRLAGTRICTFFGRELRSWEFSSLWAPGDAAAAKRIARTAMQDRKPILLPVSGVNRYQDEVMLEMVLLPIRSAGQRFDRLLGALSPVTPLRWSLDYALQELKIERCGAIGGGADSPVSRALPASRYGAIERQVHDLIRGIRRLGLRHHDPSL